MLVLRSTTVLRAERGHALFYAIVLLPFLLGLAIVAVDASRYHALADRLQRDLDRAVLQAAQALPNRELALGLLRQFPENKPYAVDLAVLDGELDRGITGAVAKTEYAVTLGPFVSLVSGKNLALSLERRASAEVVPADVALVVANGASLHPALNDSRDHPFAPPWSEAMAQGMELPGYFSACALPPVSLADDGRWNWPAVWASGEYQRWALESCFNPVFTALKLAAVQIVDTLQANRANRIAVIFSPGNPQSPGAAILRHLRGEAVVDGKTYFAGHVGGFLFTGASPEAHFPLWQDVSTASGAGSCVLLSSPEFGASPYELRFATSDLRSRPSDPECPIPVRTERSPCGRPFDYFDPAGLSNCYFSRSVSLRDAIYWQAAATPTENYSGEPDLRVAFAQALGEFADVGSREVLREERLVRGNLAYFPQRRVIVLTDSLPVVNEELMDLLASFRGSVERQDPRGGIKVTIVAIAHEKLAKARRAELLASVERLREFAKSHDGADSRSAALQIVVVESTAELVRSVGPMLGTVGKQVVLRS